MGQKLLMTKVFFSKLNLKIGKNKNHRNIKQEKKENQHIPWLSLFSDVNKSYL